MFYWNKKEAVALAQLAGLQLPGGLPKDGFIHSIRESGSKVNTKLENVTHSQQFKRWFGDWEKKPYSASKVVDADGKPLVVYHGTDADFTVFKSKDGNYWFSASEDYAEAMAEERGGNRVMQTYLNMRKPYYAKLKPSQFSDPNFEAAIIREAKSKGYDGVILENDTSNDLEKDTFYVVFAPTQIKSATDNIGTFDGSNPDIRFSKSGEDVDKTASKEYNYDRENEKGRDNNGTTLSADALSSADRGRSGESQKGWSGSDRGRNGEVFLQTKRTDEFRRIQEASQRLSDKDIELFHNGSRRVNEGLRRRLSGVFGRTLEAERRRLRYDTRILTNPITGNKTTILKGVDAKTFHDIFEIVQKFLKNGDAVDVHDVNGEYGYSNNVNFLSSTGLSGFSITPSGDLVSVFSLGEKGFLKTIRDYVKENGVITLDCYQSDVQPLADMYKKALGMKTASLLDFNYDILVEIKGKAYADFFVKTYGEAPVAFMVNTDEDVKTENFNKDQYDEAVAYRDSFIDKNTGGKSDGHTKTSEKESSDVLFSRSKDSVQTIPKVEAPARDVDVRAFDERGGNVSEGVRTVAEASVTPDSYVKPLLEDVAKGKYSHEVKTNKGAMARAENVITRDGYQETAERYLKDFEDGRSFGKDEIAVVQEWYKKVMSMMSGEIELDPLSEALIQDYMDRYRDLLRKFDSAKQ